MTRATIPTTTTAAQTDRRGWPEESLMASNLHLETLVGTKIEDEGGEPEREVFEVLQVDGFHRRVHVAVRHADGRGGDAAPLEKNRVGVGARIARVDATLEGDLVLDRDLFQPLHQHRIGHAAPA